MVSAGVYGSDLKDMLLITSLDVVLGFAILEPRGWGDQLKVDDCGWP